MFDQFNYWHITLYIKSFKDKDAEKLYNNGHNKKYKVFERIALCKLDMIEAASSLIDLKSPPGNHLELYVEIDLDNTVLV